MSELKAFAGAMSIVMGGQGLLMLIAPDRALAWTLGRYRFFGARPAQPDRLTVILYRIGGLALLAMASFLVFKIVSE